jgi:dTDP-glucose 4,6-dehydratase
MRNILITGGAGFIGGNFVHYWLREHPDERLVVLDALTYAGNMATLAGLESAGRLTFVHGDIVDGDLVARVMSEHDIDTIVHFAAESHVDRSIVEPGSFVRTNVVGTQVLLDAVRRAWRTADSWRSGVRFHHVSTDEVYGSLGPNDPPFTEETRPAKPRRIISCARTTTPTVCRPRSAIARTTTGHISFRKS